MSAFNGMSIQQLAPTHPPNSGDFIHKNYIQKDNGNAKYRGSSRKKRISDNINVCNNNVFNYEFLVQAESKKSLFSVRNDFRPYITKLKIEETVQEMKKSHSVSKIHSKKSKNDTSFDNPLKSFRVEQTEISTYSTKKQNENTKISTFLNNKFSNVLAQNCIKSDPSRNIKTVMVNLTDMPSQSSFIHTPIKPSNNDIEGLQHHIGQIQNETSNNVIPSSGA